MRSGSSRRVGEVRSEEVIDWVETAESHLCSSQPIKTVTSGRPIQELPAHTAAEEKIKDGTKGLNIDAALESLREKPESSRSRAGVEPESSRSRPGVEPESSRSRAGVEPESTRSRPGVEPESTRSRAGVEPESTQSRAEERLHRDTGVFLFE